MTSTTNDTPDRKEITCIICPNGCAVTVGRGEGDELVIDGHECKRGLKYATDEFLDPKRILATTVRIENSIIPLVPVRTAEAVPKGKLEEILEVLARVVVEAPVRCGDTIVENVIGTGVNVIATRTLGVGECRKIACEIR